MRTNLLLGAAAIGLLITGAIAQTSSSIERIKDPAGHQNSARETEPKKNVRTVYPNTQNAEQAAQQSRSAQGKADAGKRPPGDVTPLPTAEQPSSQAAAPAAQPAQTPQQSAQTPSAPPSGTQQNTPASTTQTTQAPTVQGAQAAQPSTQPVQPSNPPPSTQQRAAPAAPAQQSSTPSEPQTTQSRQGSSGIVALDTQQQTSIGQAVVRHNVKPLTNVTFSMAVGTKVPAAVQLRALPSDLATFVPQYRGYSYVVVEEQIVIVDPGTHEIVSIVPYTAAAPAARIVETPKETSQPRTHAVDKPMVSRPVNLNTEKKAVSGRPVAEQRKKTTRSVVKREYREERVPRTVTVEEFAEPDRRPAFRGHRFIGDDDDDVVVAPRQNGFFGLFR